MAEFTAASGDANPLEDWIRALVLGKRLPPVEEPAALADFMRFHGFGPLAIHLDPAGERLGTALFDLLKAQSREAFVAASEDERVVTELLSRLDDRGVPALLMKGAALSVSHYPDMGLRPRGDTDLLVFPEDMAVVAEELGTLGYSPLESPGDATTVAVMYGRPGRFGLKHTLDLHTEVTSNPHPLLGCLTREVVFANARELPGGARVLGDQDALLLAAFHRAQHYGFPGERLIWLFDIKLLVERLAPVELPLLAQRANEAGIASALLHAFVAVERWFGYQAPPALTGELHADDSALLFDEDRNVVAAERFMTAMESDLETLQKLAFAWQRLFPPPAFMKEFHGATALTLPLLYLRRLLQALRLLGPVLRRLWSPKSRKAS